jgi:23S rRNA (pseudouridine1915-N3)-methyltransferase
VGKPRGFSAQATEEYLGRIARFAPVRLEAVRPERDADGDPPVARRREGERLLAAVPQGASVVALDARGKTFSSEAFAAYLGDLADRGRREVVFLVGGAVGLEEGVRRRADLVLSLSPMTLAHEIALVVLCEQIYRAFTIRRGQAYHK